MKLIYMVKSYNSRGSFMIRYANRKDLKRVNELRKVVHEVHYD